MCILQKSRYVQYAEEGSMNNDNTVCTKCRGYVQMKIMERCADCRKVKYVQTAEEGGMNRLLQGQNVQTAKEENRPVVGIDNSKSIGAVLSSDLISLHFYFC